MLSVQKQSELNALKAKRAEVVKEMSLINARLTEITQEFRTGVRLSPHRYRQIVAEQGNLKRTKLGLEQKIADLKRDISALAEEGFRNYNLEKRRATIDEFDLRNALSEPQTLLRHALAAITSLTARNGRSMEHRALIDSIKDYMERHGIAI
jgi:hypothetical protein